MTQLTDALNRFRVYLEQNGILSNSFFPPGLTHSEIEEIVKDLPIYLPEEVYEIYQWSRGFEMESVYETLLTHPEENAYCFDGYALIALQDVVNIYQEKLKRVDYADFHELCNTSWIQIFTCYIGDTEGYILAKSDSKNCGVVFTHYKDNERREEYVSLTTMIQTLLDWYERNTSAINELDFIAFKKEFANIWRKYNSSISNAVVVKITPEISYESLIDITRDLIKYNDPNAVEPLIDILKIQTSHDHAEIGRQALAAEILGAIGDARAVEPLVNALQYIFSWVRCAAVKSLGDIGDTRAVEPLINALHDEDSSVRCNAIKSLGSLNDRRAMKSLIELLEDEDEGVRNTARIALETLGQIEPDRLEDIISNKASEIERNLNLLPDNLELESLSLQIKKSCIFKFNSHVVDFSLTSQIDRKTYNLVLISINRINRNPGELSRCDVQKISHFDLARLVAFLELIVTPKVSLSSLRDFIFSLSNSERNKLLELNVFSKSIESDSLGIVFCLYQENSVSNQYYDIEDISSISDIRSFTLSVREFLSELHTKDTVDNF